MIKVKESEFKLRQFKMESGNKTKTVYSYLFSKGDKAFCDSPIVQRDLTPALDLVNLLKRLIPIVLTVEGYSKTLQYQTLQENKDGKLIAQEIEGKRIALTQTTMPTGIVISGSERDKIQITFKKLMDDKKIVGRSTSVIDLEKNTYGIEDELTEIVELIETEVYEYIYNDKWLDKDQLDLGLFDKPIELEDTEDIKKEIEQGK